MPLYINTNTLSLNAQTSLSKNTSMLQSTMEKLSSGFRINRAGDDRCIRTPKTEKGRVHAHPAIKGRKEKRSQVFRDFA